MTTTSHKVVLKPGARARHKDCVVVIEALLTLSTVMVQEFGTNTHKEVRIAELQPLPTETQKAEHEGRALVGLPQTVREEAEFRQTVITPLLNRPGRTRDDVGLRAAEFGLNPSTLYRWIRNYDRELASLCRKERIDKGKKKLQPEVEAIIESTFAALRPEDKRTTKIHKLLKDKIESANAQRLSKKSDSAIVGIALEAVELHSSPKEALISVPHINTIRNRLAQIPERRRVARLHGKKAAEERFNPVLGSFPEAVFPLAVVQIDHTLLDIIVVDEKRKPIKRPWISLAFDPFARTVQGFYSSLDPPGAMSTGLCLSHAILPKEDWLARVGCTGEWPCWGKPAMVHGDNAFRMNMLKQACRDHGFDLEWRPVGNPRFGGHIERWLGTLGESIHFLPGTTFSNDEERGEYDSEGNATFTMPELQQWLTERILAYHAELHSQLGMPPIKKYEQGILKGTDKYPPVGYQERIVDDAEQRRLRLDLMPFELRTIQRYGVQIRKITYFHDVLRRWIRARDPEHPKLMRKFRFSGFPHNLNSIWFLDPELDEYYEIPTKDPTFPSISIWELRMVRALAKQEGIPESEIDEEYIKERYLRMRAIEEKATRETKAARTLNERRRHWGRPPQLEVKHTGPPATSEISDEAYTVVSEFSENE